MHAELSSPAHLHFGLEVGEDGVQAVPLQLQEAPHNTEVLVSSMLVHALRVCHVRNQPLRGREALSGWCLAGPPQSRRLMMATREEAFEWRRRVRLHWTAARSRVIDATPLGQVLAKRAGACLHELASGLHGMLVSLSNVLHLLLQLRLFGLP